MTATPSHRPAVREVLHGAAPPVQESVRRALTMLQVGHAAIGPLAQQLADGLEGGDADVRVDRGSRLLYATDASIYEMEPVAVVYPRSVADVQHVMRLAGRLGVPVLPRGGGTSLAGQGVNHAIVLDFTPHMGRVREIDVEAREAVVQPGTVLTQLNRAARPHGLQYAVDPSTANRATIGGGIGNNSCGAHSVVYGKTVDQVVSIDVVLADGTAATFDLVEGARLEERLTRPGLEGEVYRGVRRIAQEHLDEIVSRYPRIQRRVSGYNLDEFVDDSVMHLGRMIVGSEGTLAIVTGARVKLVPIPKVKGLAAVHYRSVRDAAHATVVALEHAPAAVELVDDTIIQRCRESIGYARLTDFIEGTPGALLMVELTGDDVADVTRRLDALAQDLASPRHGSRAAYATVRTTDAGAQARMWRVREAGLGLLMSVRGDAKPVAFVEDTAVSPERLGEFVERFGALVARHGTSVAYYGHASVGCLHIRPLVNPKAAEGLESMAAMAEEVADLVLEFGGALSGEHGDGILRGVFTERMFGPALTEAFRDVKRLFDPEGLLNPGKIVDTPPFRDNLRLGPETRNLEPRTYFDFSADGGIARAAEQCNGQGACRKFEPGMCPSYPVTMDEEHSTRGRANLLRQVLNGAMPAEELAGERLQQALDLCVECKACKAECPSGVDLAKLKYETLAHYHDAHGLPLRARLFGNIRALSDLGGRVPWLANAMSRLPGARALMHTTAGIHRDRPLPRLASRSFRAWFEDRPAPAGDGHRGDVVLFDDTFTRSYHPEVGRAATHILEALGYRVQLVEQLGCCGRPAISKGMLVDAKQWARANIDRLRPYAERGVPIVGTEPSCLLTLRDEYPELVGGAASTAVARHAVMLEELIADAVAAEPELRERFATPSQPQVLLHGHCHQKALAGMDRTLEALRLAGYEPSLIESGCCGMAGSFGFEAEHYDISRAMGARHLFPAVEAAERGMHIAITGVSCRQQIGHFTSRRPRHVAELLAASVRAPSS